MHPRDKIILTYMILIQFYIFILYWFHERFILMYACCDVDDDNTLMILGIQLSRLDILRFMFSQIPRLGNISQNSKVLQAILIQKSRQLLESGN